MRRMFSIILTLFFLLGLAGSALAAPTNPFADVPAKHWAYDAVAKLAKTGIVDGYGDGTFRGDRTMTRYEMAQIVAKAMARSDKADAENKALIDKLAVEFAAELNNLGVRVAKLEEKTRIGWNFESRIRYNEEYEGDWPYKKGTDRFDWRQRIIISGDVNDNVNYFARLETSNDSNRGNITFGTAGNQNVGFNLAYFSVKNFLGGIDCLTIGRLDTRGVTNGLLNGKDANNDGLMAAKNFGDVTLKMLFTDQAANSEAALYNLDFKLADNLKLNTAYQFGNWTHNPWPPHIGNFDYKTKSFDAGLQYKIGGVYLTGEYVSTKVQSGSDRETLHAYAIQITNGNNGFFYPTYNLVDPTKAHTDAFALSYRKNDWIATPIMSCFNSIGPNSQTDTSSRGFYLTYQNTISKNVVWTAEYQNLQWLPVGDKLKYFSTNIQFFF